MMLKTEPVVARAKDAEKAEKIQKKEAGEDLADEVRRGDALLSDEQLAFLAAAKAAAKESTMLTPILTEASQPESPQHKT